MELRVDSEDNYNELVQLARVCGCAGGVLEDNDEVGKQPSGSMTLGQPNLATEGQLLCGEVW
jgi:hypothetical protein